ncbi:MULTISPECIES: ECF transporter S component [unclassified Butyrivibrio]|uniref:ECF transporter S component n=1 Tax=unclassified Butyrivibrio TaxID=2639466 RepID=UPI0003FB3699|nr:MULTISPECIES: ECF transporter S component [unclassified Butyrivibrio]
MKNNLLASIAENTLLVAIFLMLIVAMFIAARIAENYVSKKTGDSSGTMSTRKLVIIGIFSAISAVLMLFEIPMPFAPSFYKLDISDLPAVIAGFAFGPMTGVMIEFIKILLNLVLNGTQTAFIGELANFVVGCSYVLPASIIYIFKKNRQTAFISCLVATMIITIVGSSLNAFYLLPAFAKLYGMPLDALIGMGTAINPAINNLFTFVLFAVAPINLIKGGVLSAITALVYKKLSPVLKNSELASHRKIQTGTEA